MAEHTEHVDFWKGFAAGSLVGLVAAAYARGDFKRLLSFAPPCEPQAPESAHTFRQHSRDLKMRREASENAGDPTRLSPAVTDGQSAAESQPVTIQRPSGNPGPASAVEILEVPGQPGHPLDHSDSAQRVQSALRTHNVWANRTQAGR